MQSRKVDAAFVTRPVSIAYLTGVHANPYERLMALVVGRDQATLIVPAIELENAERVKPDVDVDSWRDGEDPYRLVHRALHHFDRLGVEKDHLTLDVAEALRGRGFDVTITPDHSYFMKPLVSAIVAALSR